MTCLNCVTGKTEELIFKDGVVVQIKETIVGEGDLSFVGPGLIDIQINGINGIDFNNPNITRQDVVKATYHLLSIGVTTFLPTVITNADENICKIANTIHTACLSDPVVNDCIWGIHLEGPFISAVAGAKGAHDEKYIKAPDWELFRTYQQAAGGKIKLITLAPEGEGAYSFIRKCREEKILVSIGHSMADTEQIDAAIWAGASLATHVGNAVPLMLPRHPNILWDLLAAEELSACMITDGLHIPDSFIKVVMKTKGEFAIIVSDSTCFTGMKAGEYENHIGGKVILDKEKRVSLQSTPGLLAGAAKSLPENVEYLINHQLSTLSDSWRMASLNVAKMLAKSNATFSDRNDLVIFKLSENGIKVECVVKNGTILFEQ